MALVADEVFLDYRRDDSADHATFALKETVLTFTLSGLSKICALPQMKLAWLVVSGPPDLVRPAIDRLEIIADTYLSPSTPVQLASPKLLSLRGAMQSQVRQRAAARISLYFRRRAGQFRSGNASRSRRRLVHLTARAGDRSRRRNRRHFAGAVAPC